MKSKTLVIIPAFNEATRIEKLLQKLLHNGFEHIVVIDDGSTDQTFEIAKKNDVHCLQHVLNRGMGAATQTGIFWGLEKKFENFLTIDGDGQQNPKDLKTILEGLKILTVLLALDFYKKIPSPFGEKYLIKLEIGQRDFFSVFGFLIHKVGFVVSIEKLQKNSNSTQMVSSFVQILFEK